MQQKIFNKQAQKTYCPKCHEVYGKLKNTVWALWLIREKRILKTIEMFDHGTSLYCEVCGTVIKK
ncbi:MAG: hypothetical protein NT129_00880 [Candidatus Aenigmarchaeota archaeon]|nr:hypothetical protein [Candidatus Aenigmarchaeota archaeon]